MRYITCDECRLKDKLNKVDGTPYCEGCTNWGGWKPKKPEEQNGKHYSQRK